MEGFKSILTKVLGPNNGSGAKSAKKAESEVGRTA